MKTGMNRRGLLGTIGAFSLLASLAGCERASQRDTGDDAVGSVAEPDPAESPISIIREDIEAPVVEVELETLNATIGFPEGGEDLSAEAVSALEAALASPQMAGGGPITLRAHSDAGGSDAANLRASQARGEAVRDWLVEQGVSETRITLIAFGEQNPIEPNALPDGSPNEAGRAANRRVDLTIDLVTDPSENANGEEIAP